MPEPRPDQSSAFAAYCSCGKSGVCIHEGIVQPPHFTCSDVTDSISKLVLHSDCFTDPGGMQGMRLAAETILRSLHPFIGDWTMDPLLILGIFVLGAGAGGFCVLVQQTRIRAKFQNEIETQLDKALFDPVRRKRVLSEICRD
jgi:hypothetical protein